MIIMHIITKKKQYRVGHKFNISLVESYLCLKPLSKKYSDPISVTLNIFDHLASQTIKTVANFKLQSQIV